MKSDKDHVLSPARVGLLGMGTVGGGTYDVLTRNREEIQRRALRPVEIAAVADISIDRVKEKVVPGIRVTDDAFSIVNDESIDVIVELIGGTTIAKELVMAAINNGKHVVTANKALLALYGNEIFKAAREKGVIVAFEAAVAGGIPIIKTLREGLTANRIKWIAGIVNGTSNYILTEMRQKGISFETALGQAQELGYAESDPTFDIEGIDAAHKLTLMSAIAFGTPVAFDKAYIEGISSLTPKDIQYAEELGYRIKLLAITRRQQSGIELRVHPTLVSERHLIANVEGVMNAVMVYADAVGRTLYYGAGAGAEPTASAVIADLVDVTRMLTVDAESYVPYLAFQPGSVAEIPILPVDDVVTSYYFRMRAKDEPGVLANVTRVLANHNISIEAVIQKEAEFGDDQTDIIFLTHRALEKDVEKAKKIIGEIPAILEPVYSLRMETLHK